MTKTDIPALMAYLDTQTELRRHDSAKHIAALYKTLRCDKHRGIGRRFLQIIERLEGGPFYSRTLRELLGVHHGVQVGAYSYGQCLVPGAIPRGVKIGRFASIASGVRISLLNKPMDRLAMHPVFYDAEFNGGLETGIQYDLDLRIEADAWIGDHALILPGCHRIGIGAVIGAGSVVTRDVPDFAIVVGNPARVLRYRFDESIQQKILESQWWNHTARDLMTLGPLLFTTVTGAAMQHPLLAGSKTPVPAA